MKFSGNANKHTAQHIVQKCSKITNKQLKVLGQIIYSTYDEKCKGNFGKSLTDILVLVPDPTIEKKLCPVERES